MAKPDSDQPRPWPWPLPPRSPMARSDHPAQTTQITQIKPPRPPRPPRPDHPDHPDQTTQTTQITQIRPPRSRSEDEPVLPRSPRSPRPHPLMQYARLMLVAGSFKRAMASCSCQTRAKAQQEDRTPYGEHVLDLPSYYDSGSPPEFEVCIAI